VTFRRAIAGSLVVWAVIVAVTYLAGEQTEVVVLHTRDQRGAEFTTRMWVVDLGAVTWVRVANPERDWYQRLLANPQVELERRGRRAGYLAIPENQPTTRLTVDEAFAEKYGWVDRWYGLLVRRDAVPIRLIPQSTLP
jgi:hypothetical protein